MCPKSWMPGGGAPFIRRSIAVVLFLQIEEASFFAGTSLKNVTKKHVCNHKKSCVKFTMKMLTH